MIIKKPVFDNNYAATYIGSDIRYRACEFFRSLAKEYDGYDIHEIAHVVMLAVMLTESSLILKKREEEYIKQEAIKQETIKQETIKQETIRDLDDA